MALPVPTLGHFGADDDSYQLLATPMPAATDPSPWPTALEALIQELGPVPGIDLLELDERLTSGPTTESLAIAAQQQSGSLITAPRSSEQDASGAVRLRWRKPATQSTGVKKRRNPPKRRSKKKQQDDESADASKQLVKVPSPQPPPSVPLGDVCYWWWFCPDNMPASYRVAQNEWIESQWELAQKSTVFQECVVLFAKRKRTQLAGYVPVPGIEDGYLAQKGNLLQTIRAQMQKTDHQVDNIDVAAIAALAYCSLLDSQYDAARTHLNAMKALDLPKRFANTSEGWLYIIGLDLRFSMFENRPPILDYFIPRRYQQNNIAELQDLPQDHLWQLANRSTQMCPHTPNFSEAESFDMFLKLHSLFYAWPTLETSPTPPFGHLYDLEYRIRVADARLVSLNKTLPFSQSHCAELLLVTTQLHLWILGRFWAPISPKSRQFLLVRACRLISSIQVRELMTTWTSQANIKSLLWVLATITASAMEIGLEQDSIPLTALREAAALSGAEDREGFMDLLREWPWLENWHQGKFDWLWDAVCDLDGLSTLPKFMAARTSSRGFYLGAVEFYNS